MDGVKGMSIRISTNRYHNNVTSIAAVIPHCIDVESPHMIDSFHSVLPASVFN